MEPLAISVNGAAKALGIGRSSIYGLVEAGQLDAIKIGRRTLLTTASIYRLTDRPRAKMQPVGKSRR
jgi:excisionase family DNA binding protein